MASGWESWMKTILAIIAMCIPLIGCGEGNNETKSANVLKNPSMFSGVVGGKEYKVAVNCSYFDTDHFQFLSDKTDVSDTNGDGIAISGMEFNGKFMLTIIDNGKTFSIGNLASFSKGDNKAEGSGKLYEDDTHNVYDVHFSVICG
jgi:hypothetical protein